MAYCKHSYTVLRDGVVIANGVTDLAAVAAISGDTQNVCPATCEVTIADVAFDGTDFYITLTDGSEAPYIFIFGTTQQFGSHLVYPFLTLPTAVSIQQLFGVTNLADLIASVPQNITVVGTLQNTPPTGVGTFCSVAIMGFTVVTPAGWESGDEFLLPTSLDACDGVLTYSVIHAEGVTGATIDTNVLTITSLTAGIVMVNIYCDGLIVQTYIYNLPEPTTP